MKWKYTNIQHAARIALGLTPNEYCVADIIYKSQTHPGSNESGWAKIGCHKMGEFLGFSSGTILNMLERFFEWGLMEFTPDKRLKKMTPLWYDIAYLDDEAVQKVNVQKVNRHRSKSEHPAVQKVNANRSKSEHSNISNKEKTKEKVSAHAKESDSKSSTSEKPHPSNYTPPPSEEHPILEWETEEDLKKWESEEKITPLSVAQAMARFYKEDKYGKELWQSMCDTTGYNQPPFNICIVWAGKQAKTPHVLRDWENYTATLVPWMKNEVRSDQKQRNNGPKHRSDVSRTPQVWNTETARKVYFELLEEDREAANKGMLGVFR